MAQEEEIKKLCETFQTTFNTDRAREAMTINERRQSFERLVKNRFFEQNKELLDIIHDYGKRID